MGKLGRRAVLAGAIALPRFAIAQGDGRPSVTVAVQKISNSGVLDVFREQSSNASEHWTGSLLETLIGRNQQGALERVPGLATSWKRVDARTVELALRPGVKLHNGDVLTAEDVAFSFGAERTSAESLPGDVRAVARRYFPALERVEIVDGLTVRVVNRTPDLTLEGRLSASGAQIVSARAWREGADWQGNRNRPVGTGPYRLRTFKPDAVLELEAHDEYWGGRPPIKTLRFLEVPELASRINGLKAGEFDFACDITPDQIPSIESSARHHVVGGLITNIRGLIFDQNHKILKDPRIRRALAHAVDRKVIVETIWGGRTRVPNGLQFDYFGPMYVTDWKGIGFDPAEARRLLGEAGYRGEPIPFKVLANYYTNQVSTAQILVEMWKAVGINVDLQMRENWGQVLDGKVERAMNDNSFSAFFNDPVSFFPTTFGANGELEQGGYWRNAEAAALIERIQTSTDIAARAADFRRVLEIVERDDPAVLVMHETANFTAKRRDITWSPARSFVMDFRARNFAVG